MGDPFRRHSNYPPAFGTSLSGNGFGDDCNNGNNFARFASLSGNNPGFSSMLSNSSNNFGNNYNNSSNFGPSVNNFPVRNLSGNSTINNGGHYFGYGQRSTASSPFRSSMDASRFPSRFSDGDRIDFGRFSDRFQDRAVDPNRRHSDFIADRMSEQNCIRLRESGSLHGGVESVGFHGGFRSGISLSSRLHAPENQRPVWPAREFASRDHGLSSASRAVYETPPVRQSFSDFPKRSSAASKSDRSFAEPVYVSPSETGAQKGPETTAKDEDPSPNSLSGCSPDKLGSPQQSLPWAPGQAELASIAGSEDEEIFLYNDIDVEDAPSSLDGDDVASEVGANLVEKDEGLEESEISIAKGIEVKSQIAAQKDITNLAAPESVKTSINVSATEPTQQTVTCGQVAIELRTNSKVDFETTTKSSPKSESSTTPSANMTPSEPETSNLTGGPEVSVRLAEITKDDPDEASLSGTDTLPAVDTEEDEVDESSLGAAAAWQEEWKKKLDAMKREKEKGRGGGRRKKDATDSTSTPSGKKLETTSRKRKADETEAKGKEGKDEGAKKNKEENWKRPKEESAKRIKDEDKGKKVEKEENAKKKARSPEKDGKKAGEGSMEKKTEAAEVKIQAENASTAAEEKSKLMKLKAREMLRTLMKHGSMVYQPLCTCKIPGTTFTVIQHSLCCQALDAIDDNLVPCNGKVTGTELIRPSTRIPFMALCDLHRLRMHHHQCCPSCGVFCSQGKFLQCRRDGKWKHWFHPKCFNTDRSGDALCPHCGEKSEQHEIELRLKAMESSECDNVLGDSGDRVVREVGLGSSSGSSQKLVPTAGTSKRAKMSFEKYSAKPKTKTGKVKSEKFGFDPSLSIKIKRSDGTDFTFRHMPLGLPQDTMAAVSSILDKKGRQVRGGSRNLYKVAKDGDFEKVLFMLIDGLDPNVRQEEGKERKMALFGALESGNLAVVHLLVEAGANVNAVDASLHTVLMEAVVRKNLDLVHYLVKAKADVSAKREDGMNALHLAAQNGCNEIVEFFLRKCSVDPNAQDDGGWTAIVWAAEHGHVETARLLLQLGADPNVQDNEENTSLHWSAFSGSHDIASLLLDAGCDIEAVNDKGDKPIHIAARQDHYDCVVLFLSRGASVNAMNNNNETPLACARGDQNSVVWMALRVNAQLKSVTQGVGRSLEKMVHRDISLGRENQAVSAINAIDNQPAPLDFLYIIESVETTPLPINRTVTSLQNCSCSEDCLTLSCLCARNSLRCWYDKEGRLTKDFNYTEPPLLFECNRGCRCWKTCSNRVVQHGQTARIQIYKTKGRGWGVRAILDISQGSFICEYVGELISDSEADNREDDSYLFDLDNKDGDTYCIDARRYGNVARFINHRCEPNIIPIKVFVDHQDLRFPRICFFASTDIKAGEELGFDYGEKFWIIKYKDFLCACGSPKCKYSKAMIHQTLANYNQLQEEG